ncbi:MAG TPA: GNAT family N-acetyltransferase [Sphingomicrobium sp.]|nr:GNAT family N-acetyltransferase [Sphingomicrobium sp.]
MADEIRTDRLLLRRARMSDLNALHAALSDPDAMRYWSTPPHRTLDESETWLTSMVDADPAISDDFILQLDGRVLGKLGCWRLPEIGFLLLRDAWGQGFAGEALGAYLERRRVIGEPRAIRADVDPRNAASLRLLQRHGFVETGRAPRTWHVGGEWCDSVYLEVRL